MVSIVKLDNNSVIINGDGSLSCPGSGTNSERFGTATVAGGARSTIIGQSSTDNNNADCTIVGQGSSSTNTFAVIHGRNVTTGYNSVAVGAFISGGSNGDVVIGSNTISAGANTLVGQGVVGGSNIQTLIGQFISSSGFGAVGLGWESSPGFDSTVTLGNRATASAANQFVSGHIGWESSQIYFGGGPVCPVATGRTGNANIKGAGGQLLTAIADPTTAPILAILAGPGSTLIAGTYQVTYAWQNKEGFGSTAVYTPAGSIAVPNAGDIIQITVPAQPTGTSGVGVYVEDTPGSGNLYLSEVFVGSMVVPTTFPITVPGNGVNLAPITNDTASDGSGFDLGLFGGESDDSGVPGGSLILGTNNTGAAHTPISHVKLDPAGNFILNLSGPLAPGATNAFTYIPIITGPPSGTPDILPGSAAPMVVDSSIGSEKIWVYVNGAWMSATLTP